MTAATPGTPAVRRSGTRSSMGSAGLLLLGALVVGVATFVGVAHSYDASPLGIGTGAVWVVVLPAILAVLFAAWKPTPGLGFTAGAGVVAAARFIADLSVVTAPNSTVRPELFYEISARAQPFTRASGGFVLLLGDLLMVGAGIWAARRLGASVSFGSDRIFSAEPATTGADVGPTLLAEALGSADQTQTVASEGPAADEVVGANPSIDPTRGPVRNNLLILVGFVGVITLLAASLALPYSGGYLADRYLPPELGLLDIAAALALAIIATLAVLVAAVLPRRIAVALLGGVAAAAAVPFLTALAVRTVGAPVRLNPAVGFGLAGAVLVAAAGWLARAGSMPDDADSSPAIPVRWLNVTGAASSLLVAVAAAVAWRLPQLHYNGGTDPKLANGFAISAPLSLPFAVAMLVPLIGGVLWLIPPSARAGRAVASIGWIGLVYAVTQSLYVLGQVVASASVPNAGFAAPQWSVGPGLWWAIAGIALGVATSVIAVAATRRAADESLVAPDDDRLAESRTFGSLIAAVLTAITVVALALPVYRTSAGPSATLLVGFQVNSWGVLALAMGMVAAAWCGGRAVTPAQAIAFPLTGAAILLVRLVIPRAITAQEGFEKAAGLYAGYALAVAFVAAAIALVFSSRRIIMTDVSNLPLPRSTAARGAPRQGSRPPPAKAANQRSTKGKR